MIWHGVHAMSDGRTEAAVRWLDVHTTTLLTRLWPAQILLPRSEALLLLAGRAGREPIFRLELAGGAPRQLAQFTRGRVIKPVLSLKPGGRQ